MTPAFSICVYCGSRPGNEPGFADLARAVVTSDDPAAAAAEDQGARELRLDQAGQAHEGALVLGRGEHHYQIGGLTIEPAPCVFRGLADRHRRFRVNRETRAPLHPPIWSHGVTRRKEASVEPCPQPR